MAINTAVILWGLVFSSIGLGYYIYGRKKKNAVFRYTGITLIFYPYFIGSTEAMVLIGAVLLFVPKFIKPN